MQCSGGKGASILIADRIGLSRLGAKMRRISTLIGRLPRNMTNRETEHDAVFGDSFRQYDRDGMKPLIANLENRFEVNGLDPSRTFQGKRCFDAGSGAGPASLFMALYGAERVDAIDISPKNAEATSANARRFGFDNIFARQGSIEDLPFENDTFDVVWCYGVIHHTANPNKCLYELSRVLKVGGQLVLFVYGTGGILWYVVHQARQFTSSIETATCRALLELCGTDFNLLVSLMDNWKVPYLRAWSGEEVSARLAQLGLGEATPLRYGLSWDTNHRRELFKSDAIWMGGGDLRYVTTKTSDIRTGEGAPLPDDEVAPNPKFDGCISKRFDPLFREINEFALRNPIVGLAAHRTIFLALAEQLRRDEAFNPDEFEGTVSATLDRVRKCLPRANSVQLPTGGL